MFKLKDQFQDILSILSVLGIDPSENLILTVGDSHLHQRFLRQAQGKLFATGLRMTASWSLCFWVGVSFV